MELRDNRKYYFIVYKWKITTWKILAGEWRFSDSHEQITQEITDVHPIQFQLECNEKYFNIEENGYKKRNEYLVLNWIPLSEQEYLQYKGMVG